MISVHNDNDVNQLTAALDPCLGFKGRWPNVLRTAKKNTSNVSWESRHVCEKSIFVLRDLLL